jgi:hypothetical protein
MCAPLAEQVPARFLCSYFHREAESANFNLASYFHELMSKEWQ